MGEIPSRTWPSVSTLTAPLVEGLIARRGDLDLGVFKPDQKATVIDAGIERPGGLEAGRRIAEICLGGLGSVRFRSASSPGPWNWWVDVHAGSPVLACLGSQYAGWSLSHGEGKSGFRALGSGPGRAVGSGEELFEELGYRDRADGTVLILEVDKPPPAGLVEEISEKCGIYEDNLTFILTPTSSLAGVVQIVARVLETALHKAHALKFPLAAIIDGAGSAPLCPPAPDLLTAMSRTNDAILFAGQVHLFVRAEDPEAEALAQRLPSSASPDFGRPFGEVFKRANFDFYKIDPLLFSPACVTVTNLRSGTSFHAGKIHSELLNESFFGKFG
ncbi:MAG: methenyltetrahydromethanopterin cyclohydrolase [Gammaproteobacteria bacterium]|nr:methenyltetrahydromethanopterin cyclohydrolase [Gammaproteobacteria bacterium]